jgi:hypothetical protein
MILFHNAQENEMKIYRMHIFCLLVATCFLAGACSSSSDPGDGGTEDSGDGTNGGDVIVCQVKSDCPDEQDCIGGVCQDIIVCNCNYDCGDRSSNLKCNQGTSRCESGSTDGRCSTYCDCYANETCTNEVCVPISGDEKTCTTSDQCDQEEKCIDNRCVPGPCTTREDCEHTICLVCKDGECTKPPQICQGDADCCVGFHCNFGTCIPDSEGCLSDDDCEDPDFPRCLEEECYPECVNDADCGGGQECRDNQCVSPGCTIETCPQGQWCNPTAGPAGVGECQDGCDQNSDCDAGKQCDYDTHVCVEDCCGGCTGTQYCDTVECVCKEKCQGNQDCPPDWECDLQTGQCLPAGAGHEGDPCTVDAECDLNQGLLCDDCDICSSPPETNTCLFDCSGTYSCPRIDLACQPRGFGSSGLRMLCIPQ